MVSVDRAAPIRFLRTAYDAADWIAVFLKTYRTGDVAQRVVPVSAATQSALSGVAPTPERERLERVRQRQRRCARPLAGPGASIAAVRHVFLEEDGDGPGLLAALTTRPDLPPPSYVLHSSPGRLHVLWRTRHFERGDVEALQKRLARELDTDSAATSCAQTTRLPGFVNHKHERPVARPRRVSASANRAGARRLSRSDAALFQRAAR